jgi:AraC family transcriptional regulator, glycine betaine-responsive activator
MPLPQTVIVLLLRDFSLLSLSTALETMRIANRLNGTPLFEWRLASGDGKPVRSSLGGDFPVDTGLVDLKGHEIVLVCGGANIRTASDKPIIDWLRRQARRGVAAGGLCTAAWTLAKAGLLEGRKATIHWENQASFGEDFPDIALAATPYVIDGNRFSTAGGTSAIDLILKLIEASHGAALADRVAEQMIYSSIRLLQDGARISLPHRSAIRNPRILSDAGESPAIRRPHRRLVAPDGAAVPQAYRPVAEQILHAAEIGEVAHAAAADRYERHRRGARLRLQLGIALRPLLPFAFR